jgi:hypothetical protein
MSQQTSSSTLKAPYGFIAVKEMGLDRYAEVFSANGINGSAPGRGGPRRGCTYRHEATWRTGWSQAH